MGIAERVQRLEAKQVHNISGCDPLRRMRRYAAYFEGHPWECTGTTERRAKREADLARYKQYFEELEAGITPRWENEAES
jgi:hypothetical protein